MDLAAPLEPAAPARGHGLRLRCSDPATEADYRRWRADRAVPFARVAMYASALGWASFAVASPAVGPHLSRLAIPVSVLLILPLILLVLAATYPRRLRAALLPLSASANLVGAVAAVLILHQAGSAVGGPGYADVGTAVVVIFVYYGCTIMRLPPGLAALVVTPYVVLQQALLLDAFAGDTARRIAFSLILWIAVTSGLLLSFALERVSRTTFNQERTIEDQRRIIDEERERSERLLLSILPTEIAERLKAQPGTIADAHEDVTVLFADVVGFTALASRIGATELVALLSDVFGRFDDLTAAHGVEKIKTIGDAYMAVGGLPSPRPDHVEACAELAFAMRDTVEALAAETGHQLSFRIGLHTGPVVAGVIGSAKLAYDLWGDTVNLAARMESHGVPGQIQVTEEVARRLATAGYRLRDRGTVEVKGRGGLRTWFLEDPPMDTN